MPTCFQHFTGRAFAILVGALGLLSFAGAPLCAQTAGVGMSTALAAGKCGVCSKDDLCNKTPDCWVPGDDILLSLAESCRTNPLSYRSCCARGRNGKYVIVRDKANKPEGYLMIPTSRVTGIEDPQVVNNDDVANVWQYAWDWSHTHHWPVFNLAFYPN